MEKIKTMLNVGDTVEGITISKKFFTGEIVRILKNTVIVRNGVQAEVIRKGDIKKIVTTSNT